MRAPPARTLAGQTAWHIKSETARTWYLRCASTYTGTKRESSQAAKPNQENTLLWTSAAVSCGQRCFSSSWESWASGAWPSRGAWV